MPTASAPHDAAVETLVFFIPIFPLHFPPLILLYKSVIPTISRRNTHRCLQVEGAKAFSFTNFIIDIF